MKTIKKIIIFTMCFLNFYMSSYAQTPIEAQLSRIEEAIWGFEYSKDDLYDCNVFVSQFIYVLL